MRTQTATLVKKTILSPDITDFRIEAADGAFSDLAPGAHVDVRLGEALVRQYSVLNWDPVGSWISIAVKREDAGRGGSLAMHELPEGAKLEIGGPRNHFPLGQSDGHVTLIAGGIGVTPIYAMARQLRDEGADFRLHYLARSRIHAALDPQLRALDIGARYHLHCSDTDGRANLSAIMRSVPVGGDVYACGPEQMLNAVLAAGRDLRGGTIHFERFTPAADIAHCPNGNFIVEIASTGAVHQVGPDETILSVLQKAGIQVDFGCSEGLCGSCMVDVVSGEVDHRDGVLSPEEQETNEFMCVCVSRAKSDRLVLKL